MSDLGSRVLHAATEESRLNPDKQRRCSGAFVERMVLSIPLDNSRLEDTKERFEDILRHLASDYGALFVKIPPKLAAANQCYYMKVAQNLEIQATIVDEKNAHSPYGTIIHPNQAGNADNPSLAVHLPQAHDKPKKAPRKGFWSKLFNKD